MDDSIEGFVESEESFLTLRGVTEVFFQLTALTSDRVELGESDAVIQLSLTCSSMKGIVSWRLVGRIHSQGTKVLLFVLHH